ncbi:hypothetical protein PAP_04480 [Palaeococcus pacificus DY20341]|uniref:Type II secretion system protein GspF domain-containing protein n=1 Tax=Palaeococcus pacificus DY20341 TaxID=1343739 RepID=A0A075LTM1_9EURY|nr:archaellar assembly protein FlaJ [Palaeococcus pacificus]AIF69307.1 hypothetical protein PAP_04480 [Palaeococcus pacificus DY20341]
MKNGASIFVKADLNMKDYLRRIVVPNVALSIVLFISISFLIRVYNFSRLVKLAVYIVAILPVVYAALYPTAKASSKSVQTNSRIPYFATYFAVLSTSDVGREDLVLNIASEKSLEPIASDMRKIYLLIAKFNTSFPKALRFLSKRTPSKVFSDFLERLAYSLDSGVDLKEYLLREQKTVMDDYETFYEGALYDLDVFKEIYSSVIIGVVFLVTFIIIGPLITGQSVEILIIFSLIVVLAIEIGILVVIKHRMPEDRIWTQNAMTYERKQKMIRSILISIVGILIVSVLYVLILKPRFNIPIYLSLALIVTPLAYFGRMLDKEESRILIKDENFPAFIRSLSTSLASSGGSLVLVLKYLSSHDFGSLTKDIKNLYNRMALRVSDMGAWRHFNADTGSWLISMFSEIFRKSIRLGAEPEYVGLVISRNFERLIRLRRRRTQSVSSFKGVIFGITAAFAFSLMTALQIVEYINNIFSNVQVQGEFLTSILFLPSEQSLVLTSYVIILIITIHSLMSSIAIKFADGGHIGISVYYFVVLMWISAISMFLGEHIISKMIRTGSMVLPIMEVMT